MKPVLLNKNFVNRFSTLVLQDFYLTRELIVNKCSIKNYLEAYVTRLKFQEMTVNIVFRLSVCGFRIVVENYGHK